MFAKLLPVALLSAALAHAELPVESIGKIRTLPVPYPAHWVAVHDGSFFHMSDGKVIVLDADADKLPEQFKGFVNNAFMGQFVVAPKRRELLVAETFYSRGQRGERTDVLTIYDQGTLAQTGEVVLPGGKRFSGMPELHALQLIDNERLALVFNLTPATSVYVVDLDKRALLGEVQIPGCSLIYPTGKRGFSSLCGDGALLSYQLDAAGKVAKETRGKPVWDVSADALFEKPVLHKGIASFPSFKGQMLPVDLNGDAASAGEAWSLLDEADRAAGWRPGGWQFLARDQAGKLYMLFHPEGANGTHKNPGTEVWVYDLDKRVRERRIALNTPAISLMLTNDDQPLLIATTHEMQLDVYDAGSGKLLRTIGAFGQETPFIVYAVN